jgi:ubiquitin C
VLIVKPRGFNLKRVVVRNLDSLKEVVIMTGPATTIDNMKAKIQNKFGIPASDQKLVFRTTVLIEGSIAELLRFEQEEAVMHVRDLRTMQVFIHTMSGRSSLIEVVPSLPVLIVKVRIQTIAGLEHLRVSEQRLYFAGRELRDGCLLSDYSIQDESTIQLSLRMIGGSMPEQEQESSEEELTDEDRSSQGSTMSGDTDRTASMDSLATDDDGGLFDHRLLRVELRFNMYAAGVNPSDYESDSQATTIPYIPDDLAVIDSHPDSSRAGSITARSDGVYGVEEGEPDPDVSIDFQPAPCRARSIDAEGDGEPDGKRARLCGGEGCYQIWVKTLTGKTIILWVEAADTISTVKLALAVFMGWSAVRPIDLRLVFSGSQLEDHRTLGDHKILEGSTVHAALRVRGGGKRARVGDDPDDDDDFGLQQELEDIFAEEEPPQEIVAVEPQASCNIAAVAAPAVVIEDNIPI